MHFGVLLALVRVALIVAVFVASLLVRRVDGADAAAHDGECAPTPGADLSGIIISASPELHSDKRVRFFS